MQDNSNCDECADNRSNSHAVHRLFKSETLPVLNKSVNACSYVS